MYTDYPELPEGFEEAIQKFIDFFKEHQYVLDHLAATPVPEMTADELALAIKLASVLEPLMLARNILGHRALYHATAVFHHVEKLAKEGNEEAQKAYEKLLPGY